MLLFVFQLLHGCHSDTSKWIKLAAEFVGTLVCAIEMRVLKKSIYIKECYHSLTH